MHVGSCAWVSVCARVSTKPTRAYARERLYAQPTYVYLLVRRSYQEHRISQYMQQSLYTCLNINCRSRCGISCQAPALKAPSKSTPPLSIVVQSCSLHLEVISTLCSSLFAPCYLRWTFKPAAKECLDARGFRLRSGFLDTVSRSPRELVRA